MEKKKMKCRECGEDVSDGINMFIHNIFREDGILDCNRDSAIEFIEQMEYLKT